MSYISAPCYKSAIFSIHLFYFFLYTLYNDLSTLFILGNDQEKNKKKTKKKKMECKSFSATPLQPWYMQILALRWILGVFSFYMPFQFIFEFEYST